MSSIAIGRLTQERKDWRKDPLVGFYARPSKKADNSNDMMLWEAGIPGKAGTDWEGGVFTVTMKFHDDYPVKAPLCCFSPPIFHPNVYGCGQICLSIINHDGWRPAITIRDMVLGFQDLLDNPNPLSPANGQAEMLLHNKAAYSKRIKEQALKFVPDSSS